MASGAAGPLAGSGSGSAVLVHGAWGGPQDWHWVRRLLQDAGVRVHTPDLPSHRGPDAGLPEDAEHVRAVLRAASPPVVLVGFSWGGDVIGVASHGEEGVRHLLHVASCPRAAGSAGLGTGWIEQHEHIALTGRGTSLLDDEWWLEQEVGTTFPAHVREHLRRHPRRPASVRIDTDAQEGPAGWESTPTTVLLGRDDPLVGARQRAEAAQRCADVRVLEGDHFLIWRAPEQVAAVVLEALRGG
ncbi:alpha/beta fold hydrolase [Kineococcus indalonis]|uniref:alpha/beta fold hydrolase n=1 Tax=Kineococcus indalonis TaxID=2696566 RepID=UPI001412D0F3|nr:alpha/beta hydrolase [Kineococcus indalonis]NAZ86070.1 alpha/beta fold hydrolase [Kineococcus indalonis]